MGSGPFESDPFKRHLLHEVKRNIAFLGYAGPQPPMTYRLAAAFQTLLNPDSPFVRFYNFVVYVENMFINIA